MADEEADIPFDRSLNAGSHTLQTVSPLVRRVIANNAGPFTFTGTCTYVVGRGAVTVIDPGPNDSRHLATLLAALKGEVVETILVTHTHKDHSTAAVALREATGAPVKGCARHRSDPVSGAGAIRASDASNDLAYNPDQALAEGERISGEGYDLVAVATPGHAANHVAFALPQERALFSGDHVMAWSTTVVAPPDGSMRAYMVSLDKLLARDEVVYWPGHGGPVRQPSRFVKALILHRRQREGAILRRLEQGDSAVETLVDKLYVGLAPALKGAAAMSVLAHLEDLADRKLVRIEGPFGPRARFNLA